MTNFELKMLLSAAMYVVSMYLGYLSGKLIKDKHYEFAGIALVVTLYSLGVALK